MNDEQWTAAKIIPTSGISGDREQETRTTSALLAVLTIVPEYTRALLAPFGAPTGPIEAFIEVPFVHDGRKVYPDGLIRIRGRREVWSALVEVKTGANQLEPEQIEKYLAVARNNKINAVITISNEIPSLMHVHPLRLAAKATKDVKLFHLPWSSILATAFIQKEHRGVSDPEQAWILGELIGYLEHAKSGAQDFNSMGSYWTTIRDAVTTGTFRTHTTGASEVVARFDGLLNYIAIRLTQKLGEQATVVQGKAEREDPNLRPAALLHELYEHGSLSGELRTPSSPYPIRVSADLRAGKLTICTHTLSGPQAREVTKVKALVRSLDGASPNLRIDSFVKNGRESLQSELLSRLRETPEALIGEHNQRILKGFDVALVLPLGAKNGAGRGTFIASVVDGVDTFYDTVAAKLAPREPLTKELFSFTPKPEHLFAALDFAYSKINSGLSRSEARVRIIDTHSNEFLARNARQAYIGYLAALVALDEYREVLLTQRDVRKTLFAHPEAIDRPDLYAVLDDDFAVYSTLSRQVTESNLLTIGEFLGMTVAIEELPHSEDE